MRKIALSIAALALSFSLWAQGNTSGEQLVKYERYSSAKTALANKTSETDRYYLGLAEIGLGNIAAAEQIFNSMSGNEYGKAGLARIAFLKGDINKGNSLVQDIVDGAKKKDYYKYQLAADAITYSQKGNFDKAIEWYKKAMEKGQSAELLVSLGDAYLLKKDALSNGEADRSFTEATKVNNNYSLGYSRLGKLMYAARNYEKALEYYTSAKNADPSNPLPYRDLADAYYRAGKYALAKENADKYFQLSDATEDDIYQYVNILFLSKEYDATLKQLNSFFSKNPNPKPYLHRIKGYSLYETGNSADALASMNTFFNTEKDAQKFLFEDYLYKGKIFADLASKDTAHRIAYLDSANRYINKAATMDTATDKTVFFTESAEIFQKAQDYAKTAEWYGKILSSKETPSSLDYYYYGFYSYYAQQYDQAMNTFNTMYDKFESDRWSSEYWRGLIASTKDQEAKTGQAENYFKNWLDMKYPEGKTRSEDQLMRAYQYLTYYYYNTNKSADALKYAKLILAMDPANEFATSVVKFFNK